jgi:hypothetical protein
MAKRTGFFAKFSSGQLVALLERRHFSRLTFCIAFGNAVCVALVHWKQRKQSTWKSYVRKFASIAAGHL